MPQKATPHDLRKDLPRVSRGRAPMPRRYERLIAEDPDLAPGKRHERPLTAWA